MVHNQGIKEIQYNSQHIGECFDFIMQDDIPIQEMLDEDMLVFVDMSGDGGAWCMDENSFTDNYLNDGDHVMLFCNGPPLR